MSFLKVAVECNPDEELLRRIGFSKREIAHQASIGDVCNFLKKSDLSFAMIDEDPNSSRPHYLSEFSIVEERYSVKILKHDTLNKTILVLKPRLEEWIYEQCQISKINPKDFQFPPTASEFKSVINKRLNAYGKMLEALIKNKNPGIAFLKNHLASRWIFIF